MSGLSRLYKILSARRLKLVLQWLLISGICALWLMQDAREDSGERLQLESRQTSNVSVTLREWQRMVKNQDTLIVQASKQDSSDGWQPYPIGMSYAFLLQESEPISLQIGMHQDLVLCALSPRTDGVRRLDPPNRESIIQTLKENGISNQHVDTQQYFEALPRHKFIISPEGNGIDCHRHYEALMAGSIPVVEYNSDLQHKYGDCPILYTNNSYQDITAEYLETMYHEMLDRTYDFSHLFLAFYDKATQDKIIAEGNFWCEKLAGRKWYTAKS